MTETNETLKNLKTAHTYGAMVAEKIKDKDGFAALLILQNYVEWLRTIPADDLLITYHLYDRGYAGLPFDNYEREA